MTVTAPEAPTPAQAASGVNPDVAWAVEDIRRRLEDNAKAVNYYEGRHVLNFATEKFRNAFGLLFREFADNLCDDVVDEPVDRLQIAAWFSKGTDRTKVPEPDPLTGEPPEPEADPLSQRAQELWEANQGDARAGEVHLNGYRNGDGFLIVWEDPEGQPTFYPQDPDKMAVRYSKDQPDRIEVAAKVWREGKVYRLTLYYQDRIERYTTKGTGSDGGLPQAKTFIPLNIAETDDRDSQSWVEPHNYGRCPVFHFPRGKVGKYGRSVLADVYPLQDALNKSVADMLVAMEFHALPQRWGVGIQVERDPVTGEEIVPFKGGAERLMRTANEKASFGQFATADLGQFLEVQDGWRLEIARKGALPPHSVNLRGGGGNAPSGLSLLVSEGKMIKRVKDAQRDWGVVWREAMAFALSMGGEAVAPKDLDLEWAPAETRDELALLEGLVIKKDLGVPDRQLLLEMGYDAADVAAFLAEKASRTPDFGPAAGRPPMSEGRVGVLESALGVPQSPPPPPGAPEPAMAR